MNYRPNDQFVPQQERKKYVCVFRCWWTNECQESQAADECNILCGARYIPGEVLSLLDWVMVNYVMNISRGLWHGQFKKEEKVRK
jgi:hypothetical protein